MSDREEELAEAHAASIRPASMLPAVLCGVVYLLAFLALASVLVHHFGFPLDDSWIHEVIARNLAEYHVLGFRGGKLSPGSSSLLWTLLLACRWMVCAHRSPVLYCAAVSCATLFGIGFVLKRLTEDDGLGGRAAGAWLWLRRPVATFYGLG